LFFVFCFCFLACLPAVDGEQAQEGREQEDAEAQPLFVSIGDMDLGFSTDWDASTEDVS
jgi:hypothetical protein